MTKPNDGGPAFPQSEKNYVPASETGGGFMAVSKIHGGMTLRDWFAGQALSGLCGNSGGPFQANDLTGWNIVNCRAPDVAAVCFELADAMIIAAREIKP